MTDVTPTALGVALIALSMAAITDLWVFRIQNRLTLPLLVGGLLYQTVAGAGLGWRLSLLGASLGFAVLMPLYAFGRMGAGDVKLLTGIGAWLGPALTAQLVWASFLACGVYAVIVLVARQFAHPPALAPEASASIADDAPESLSQLVDAADRRRRLIPFAAMVLAGFVTLVLTTHSP